MLGQINVPCRAAAAIVQYTCVKLTTAAGGNITVTPCTAATDKVFGIAQEAASAAGEIVSVCIFGETYAKASAAITVGTQLQSETTALVRASGAGLVSFGICSLAAGALNDIIKCYVGVGNGQGT